MIHPSQYNKITTVLYTHKIVHCFYNNSGRAELKREQKALHTTKHITVAMSLCHSNNDSTKRNRDPNLPLDKLSSTNNSFKVLIILSENHTVK